VTTGRWSEDAHSADGGVGGWAVDVGVEVVAVLTERVVIHAIHALVVGQGIGREDHVEPIVHAATGEAHVVIDGAS
jgi:hypothetical protein